MISAIIATLKMIYDYAEDHPDVVKMLADDARKLLSGHSDAANNGAAYGLAAGMAASRANAVQAALRGRGIGDIDRARRIVHDWAVSTSTKNATLCQDDAVREAMAELLRDIGAVKK